jgi:hypothetical protein
MDANQRIYRLVEWATSHGASLHPLVEVYDDAVTGFSFRVKQDPSSPEASQLAAWEPVVSVPTSLTLSYLNALPQATKDSHANNNNNNNSYYGSGSHPFSEEFLAKTPPHVVGRFFLIYQYLLGEESFWWPYIQALPQPDEVDAWQLAPFWPADDAELLEGTNVEVGLEKIKKDVRNEFSRTMELLAGDERLSSAITMKLYQWAYCIFSSRSFRPSLVLPLGEEEEGIVLPRNVKTDDFSVLLPLFDIGNHDMTAEVRWNVLGRGQQNGTALENGETRCELRVGQAFQPGQQIFNNYSFKTNAELLLGYGFMIPQTEALHNDYTHVRKRTTGAEATEEYYISLRPMSHPSSVLGRAKQTIEVDLPPGRSMLAAFCHVQTDMAWDIFTTLVHAYGDTVADLLPFEESPSGQNSGDLERRNRERDQQQRFFCGDVGPRCAPFVEQTVGIIQNKLLQELERLDETDVEVPEGEEENLTANQRLALEYRKRCRMVLEQTLENLTL